MSLRSLDGLIDFLEAGASVGYPNLTATPTEDLYAEWQGPHGQLLAVEFLDSGEAGYQVFRPNPKHPQRVDRLTGSTTADALGESIAPLVHATAFKPRPGEPYLSVNWLELLALPSRNAEIAELRRVLAAKRAIGSMARFVERRPGPIPSDSTAMNIAS
jgi:hypothetical protein